MRHMMMTASNALAEVLRTEYKRVFSVEQRDVLGAALNMLNDAIAETDTQALDGKSFRTLPGRYMTDKEYDTWHAEVKAQYSKYSE